MPTPLNIKSPEQQRLEVLLGRDLGIYLEEQVEQGRTQADIASVLKLDRATVSRWMRQYGVRPGRRRAPKAA